MEQNLSAEQKKRLNVLKDTRIFSGEYFTFIRNGKSGRERVGPIIGKDVERIVA